MKAKSEKNKEKQEWEQSFYTFFVKRKHKNDQPGIWVKQKEGDKEMQKLNRRKITEYIRRAGMKSLKHWEGVLVFKKQLNIEARPGTKKKGNFMNDRWKIEMRKKNYWEELMYLWQRRKGRQNCSDIWLNDLEHRNNWKPELNANKL